MPLFKTITLPDGLIAVWELTEKSDDLISNFTSEELEYSDLKKYTYEKRKVEWLATRALLKLLVGSDFILSYSETGKPMLDHRQYKHISISHSRYFLVVFIHEKLNVGIDIEDITRNYNAVEKRYLSEEELIAVNKNILLQCIYWCAKEAIFKMVPDDGVEFREQIHILPFNPEKENQFMARYSNKSQKWIYPLQFQNFSDHCLVWVLEEPTGALNNQDPKQTKF
jgi:phosphopantetheinyl transferase